nr:MAG TPA: hypothetical protein [Caudoviricetes sp.]DAY34061.1 MAG TPA: hypothetical protein [Caudoviricetes sp.]
MLKNSTQNLNMEKIKLEDLDEEGENPQTKRKKRHSKR